MQKIIKITAGWLFVRASFTAKMYRCDKLHEAVNLVKDDLPFVKLIWLRLSYSSVGVYRAT